MESYGQEQILFCGRPEMTYPSAAIREKLKEISAGGATPAYYYFRSLLRNQLEGLREAFPSSVAMYYSVKSNPHPGVLATLADLGVGFDCASVREIERVCRTVSPRWTFGGPGKSDEDLRFFLGSRGGAIVIESANEWKRLAAMASPEQERENRPSVFLRVNPALQYDARGGVIRNRPSAFGIGEDEIAEVMEGVLRKEASLKFEGLHFHVQSQLLVVETILRNFAVARNVARELRGRFASQLKTFGMTVYLGGGLGIPYSPSDQPLDIKDLGVRTRSLLSEQEMKDDENKTRWRLELGRYLSGPAGFFVTRVVDKKRSWGRTYLVVDGGFSNHMAATGYGTFQFGGVVPRNFPIGVLRRASVDTNIERVHISGPSCFASDLLARDIDLPALAVGDEIVIGQSGSYGPTFSPQAFLGLREPAEVFVDD